MLSRPRGLVPHGLRHTTLTWMGAAAGVDLHIVQRSPATRTGRHQRLPATRHARDGRRDWALGLAVWNWSGESRWAPSGAAVAGHENGA